MTKKINILLNTDGYGNPLARLFGLISFLRLRRRDTRFPVLPLGAILKYSIAFLVVLLCMFSFADQPYLDAVRADKINGTYIFETITKIGKSNWILIATGVCILIMGFISGEKFTGKLHAVWHRAFFTTWFVFYSIGMSGIIAVLLKLLFGRSRPRFVNGESAVEFSPFLGSYEFSSFPSGHSTTAGALIVCFALLMPRYKYLFLIIGLIIASTRTIVGAHFPSDVFAGLAVGAVFTWIYARSMAKDRIIFKFTKIGTLTLRKEGDGHCHKIPSMFLQGFGGNSENKYSKNNKADEH